MSSFKNCIGFIFDLSKKSKEQLADGFDIDIEDKDISSFLNFMKNINFVFNNNFDFFIGSCGVNSKYGKVCDLFLLINFFIQNNLFPTYVSDFKNSTHYKDEFINILDKEYGAKEISKIVAEQLNEDQCQYLLSALSNFPNIYSEIGYKEYKEFHEDNPNEYFKIYPHAKSNKSFFMTLLQTFFSFFGNQNDPTELEYSSLINDPYRALIEKVYFLAFNMFDWKTCPSQFLLLSPQEIFRNLARFYFKLPPKCKEFIYSFFNTYFCDNLSFLSLSLDAAFGSFNLKDYDKKFLVIVSKGTVSPNAIEKVKSNEDVIFICCYLSKK